MPSKKLVASRKFHVRKQDYNTIRRTRQYTRKQNRNICKKCNKIFSSEAKLKEHIVIHSSTKCNVVSSSKKSSKRRNLKKKLKQNDESLQCKTCGKQFGQRHTLHMHVLIHSGVKPHVCDVCQKSFVQKVNLEAHKLVHSGEKPHACIICNQEFTQVANLRTHQKIHYGIKPHVCSHCGKEFSQKGNLKTHLLIHDGAKPYQCEVCGENFRQKSHVDKHSKICQKEPKRNLPKDRPNQGKSKRALKKKKPKHEPKKNKSNSSNNNSGKSIEKNKRNSDGRRLKRSLPKIKLRRANNKKHSQSICKKESRNDSTNESQKTTKEINFDDSNNKSMIDESNIIRSAGRALRSNTEYRKRVIRNSTSEVPSIKLEFNDNSQLLNDTISDNQNVCDQPLIKTDPQVDCSVINEEITNKAVEETPNESTHSDLNKSHDASPSKMSLPAADTKDESLKENISQNVPAVITSSLPEENELCSPSVVLHNSPLVINLIDTKVELLEENDSQDVPKSLASEVNKSRSVSVILHTSQSKADFAVTSTNNNKNVSPDVPSPLSKNVNSSNFSEKSIDSCNLQISNVESIHDSPVDNLEKDNSSGMEESSKTETKIADISESCDLVSFDSASQQTIDIQLIERDNSSGIEEASKTETKIADKTESCDLVSFDSASQQTIDIQLIVKDNSSGMEESSKTESKIADKSESCDLVSVDGASPQTIDIPETNSNDESQTKSASKDSSLKSTLPNPSLSEEGSSNNEQGSDVSGLIYFMENHQSVLPDNRISQQGTSIAFFDESNGNNPLIPQHSPIKVVNPFSEYVQQTSEDINSCNMNNLQVTSNPLVVYNNVFQLANNLQHANYNPLLELNLNTQDVQSNGMGNLQIISSPCNIFGSFGHDASNTVDSENQIVNPFLQFTNSTSVFF